MTRAVQNFLDSSVDTESTWYYEKECWGSFKAALVTASQQVCESAIVLSLFSCTCLQCHILLLQLWRGFTPLDGTKGCIWSSTATVTRLTAFPACHWKLHSFYFLASKQINLIGSSKTFSVFPYPFWRLKGCFWGRILNWTIWTWRTEHCSSFLNSLRSRLAKMNRPSWPA